MPSGLKLYRVSAPRESQECSEPEEIKPLLEVSAPFAAITVLFVPWRSFEVPVFCFMLFCNLIVTLSASPRACTHSFLHISLSTPPYPLVLRTGPTNWKILSKTFSEHLLNQKPSCFLGKSEACSAIAEGHRGTDAACEASRGLPAEEGVFLGTASSMLMGGLTGESIYKCLLVASCQLIRMWVPKEAKKG